MEDRPVLVLSRKVGEKVVIGDNITITVQRVAGGRVSLAIEAPRDVRILRGELDVFENPQSPAIAGLGPGHADRSYPMIEDHANI